MHSDIWLAAAASGCCAPCAGAWHEAANVPCAIGVATVSNLGTMVRLCKRRAAGIELQRQSLAPPSGFGL